ncbi:M15 family metallopeptidase [Luteimonas terricola]|uniref:Peptidase n=1 Tax=Luteimonas terricola TaxID=645597 RepID=A0ABQ2EHJ7_9GAMM|nr:M15 family metallopeptidase [Luteimonas terricola]GGK11856.1 peptidase [Luteimonas terricola]
MRGRDAILANTPDIELWPGGVLRARGNRDARALARARTVLRRKRDGTLLAADLPEGLLPLVPRLAREPGLDAALAALEHPPHVATRNGIDAVPSLPPTRLASRLDALGIDGDAYAARTGLALEPEPAWLASAGHDRYRRALWLRVDAARGWRRLVEAAGRDGIVLEAVSGYRSHDYQAGIIERKLARGLGIEGILAVNAAPGWSEHHSGCAIDISAPGEPAAEESFEATRASAWLQANAAALGFAMSYPRGNPHGIVYEPWHWRFGGTARDD